MKKENIIAQQQLKENMKNVFNNKGFTLLEAMMGMFIMAIISVLILQMMLVVTKNMNTLKNQRQLMLFIMQIQKDLISTKKIEFEENGDMKLSGYKETFIEYDFSEKKHKILRQKNGKGSEIALYEVKNVNYSNINNLLEMEIDFIDKKKNYKILLGNIFK